MRRPREAIEQDHVRSFGHSSGLREIAGRFCKDVTRFPSCDLMGLMSAVLPVAYPGFESSEISVHHRRCTLHVG